MRTFNFRARNIGEEKYLSYTMGEDCELDEDVLDYCQDNAPEELIEIIYEEDDDYDYLTYQITGKTSLEEYITQEHDFLEGAGDSAFVCTAEPWIYLCGCREEDGTVPVPAD